MMQEIPQSDRLVRNVERLKAGGASDAVIDRYLAAEGVRSKLVRVWRRPLVGSGVANGFELAALRQRYKLER